MIRVLAIFLFAVTAAPASAQFRSAVDLVSFGVTVVDSEGQVVTGLTVDDFEVIEEDEEQDVEFFAAGTCEGSGAPALHLGLLLDTSGSMDDELEEAKTSAIRFLSSLTKAEDITLVDFDTEVRVAQYSNADFPRLVERVRAREPEGWTALYDALGVYLDGAFSQDGQKVLVIYTDGEDTRSAINFGDTQDLLRASDVTVYVVGLLRNGGLSGGAQDRMRMQQMADITGGRAYFPLSIDALDDVYGKVQEEIDARYTLGYVPRNLVWDGSWRGVSIRLVRPGRSGLELRTREGYYAPYRDPDQPNDF